MSAPDRKAAAGRPGRLIYGAVAGAAVLAIAAGAAFYLATQQRDGSGQTADLVRVSVSARACDPNEITVPGGRRSFEIVNASDRPIEWEILDGVMVVAERENIAPGFRQTLSAQLAPGDYAITCGLLSNPRGVLHVTESEESRAAAATVGLRHFLGPLSEYKVYLVLQGTAAVDAAADLAQAIAAGDLETARRLWSLAREPYMRLEPMAVRLSDLANAIDPVADYLEGREDDPAFIGFHRIEYGLFAENTTDGLGPVAERLVADMTALKDRLGAFALDPTLLIAIPRDMAAQLAQGRIATGENHYARTDLADIAANLDGIRKVAGLLRSVVAPVDPELEAEIADRLDAVDARLAELGGDDGFPSYESVDDAARSALAEAFGRLAETLDRLHSVIGVS
ncbi:MAG: iron uptake system protein EfeO [Rhodospirillaceae bacterium]|nr:iron uptake system protein EfeO [Rhodospirillaceae bacterium]